VIFLMLCQFSYGQDNARISGSLQTQGNFFIRDSLIGAANTPQYDHQLYGADTWLQLNYAYKGFDVGVRFDVFHQSNLLDPQSSYTDQGIGRWYVKKKINKLGISGGYLYDQIGSGIIFRAFEQRPLLIDNALYGLRLTYDINENWLIKAFSGKQKQQFSSYGTILKGLSVDGFIESKKEGQNWTLSPGFGVVAKTLDDDIMRTIVGTINSYNVADSIGAKYNTYAMTAYNTLSAGKFNWYVEGAYKTAEQFFDPRAIRKIDETTTTPGKLVFRRGTVFYTALSYADKGLGVTLEAKRTENFSFRTNPFVTLNQGAINFLPPMTRFKKPGKENVVAITPFVDFLYKISKKKAIRFETQYMNTEQDYGGWLFGLAEFTMAPHWTFTISDMYNVSPNPKNDDIATGSDGKKLKLHYPRFDVFYTYHSNRFSIGIRLFLKYQMHIKYKS